MKKNSKFTEELLLSNNSLDELIKLKMQEELKNAFEKRKLSTKRERIIDIKDVPKGKIFSKQAIFKVFNKNTQIETLINGLQAESLLGMQNDVREKLLSAQTDIFSTDSLFIKFEYIEC